MRKTILGFFILSLTLLSLTACGGKKSDPSTDEINTFVSTLEGAGYSLTAFDKESRDYHANHVKTLYDINVVVEAYYAGYISVDAQQTRYVRVILFEVTSQAIDYVNAFEGTEEGLLLYRDGSVVVYTFSSETIALFTS